MSSCLSLKYNKYSKQATVVVGMKSHPVIMAHKECYTKILQYQILPVFIILCHCRGHNALFKTWLILQFTRQK
jgi:hypothetical protein